jgi:uncharacterized protein (TIGR02246 family)
MTVEHDADLSALAERDDAAVRAGVAAYAETWNRHDMPAMHALNTEDVEWINVTGNHWRTNPVVYRGHDNIHRTIFAETRVRIDSVEVRGIVPGAALAVATMMFGPVITPSGAVLPELRTRGSFVFAHRGGTWKIVHFHNTSIDAEAEQHDPATWDVTGLPPQLGRR